MLSIHRIGLFTRDTTQDYPKNQLLRLFSRAGIELVDDPEELAQGQFDLVIALGGDGTVLRALAAHPATPVLAINFGTIGFLTQADRSQLNDLLVRLLADEYQIEERLSLDIELDGQRWRAVNEAVIKSPLHMAELAVNVNGQRMFPALRGDGLIIGTPTGSTAYLLSTGAPIVTPEVDCMIIKPLNEYSLSSRSVIVPGSTQVQVELLSDREDAVHLIIDGTLIRQLSQGDRLTVRRSNQPARLMRFDEDYFFRNLRERLRW